MNTKHQVISGIIGGIVGSIITALMVSSGTAQRDKFGDIECTSLRVVDKDGKTRVILSTDASDGLRDAKNIRVRIIGRSGPFGSTVSVLDEDGLLDVMLRGGGEHGGFVGVWGNKVGIGTMVEINVNEHGGVVSTKDEFGNVKTLD